MRTKPSQIPLTFRSFGAEGGHLVVESCWKELTVPLIVDTGSTHSLLHTGLFMRDSPVQRPRRGATKGSAEALLVLGAGGSVSCPEDPVFVQGMRIGGLTLPAMFWNLIDLRSIRNRYRENSYSPPCGLIGLDILRQIRAVVHCGAMQLWHERTT